MKEQLGKCSRRKAGHAKAHIFNTVDLEAQHAHAQEVGFCHMRINDGVNSRLQLAGLLARMCRIALKSKPA